MQLHAAHVEGPPVEADRQRPDRQRPDRRRLTVVDDVSATRPRQVLDRQPLRQPVDGRCRPRAGMGGPTGGDARDRAGQVDDLGHLHVEAAAGDDGATARQVGHRGRSQPEQERVGRIAQPEDQALAHRA